MTVSLEPLSDLQTPRYHLNRLIKRFETHSIYAAFDRETGTPTMLHVLSRKLSSDPTQRTAVRERLHQIGQLSHPNLAPIYHAQEHNGRFFWTTPYFDKTLLNAEDELFTSALSAKLRSGLDYLHKNGLIHGNINPDVVYFDVLNQPFLGGFAPLTQEQHSINDDQLALSSLSTLPPKELTRWQQWQLHVLILASLLCFVIFLVGRFAPFIGATLATPLRAAFGNQAVAQLETTLFQVQDASQQTKYALGLAAPEAPWEITPTTSHHLEEVVQSQPTVVLDDVSPLTPISITTTKASIEHSDWESLIAIPSISNQPDEGVWQDYIFNSLNELIARRTFLHPDEERPLTTIGIVAFDLSKTHLSYVPGTEEPVSGGAGRIPTEDREKLLATFNGGFMTTHGNFGAMWNRQVLIEPRSNLATIAIDNAGAIQIGEWNVGVLPSSKWTAYRQNARLIIDDGMITPEVYSNDIEDWGGTINSEIVTWRSAVAINDDKTILYYFAGPSLSMPALARAGVTAGVEQMMLLDINAYWVHFADVSRDIPVSLFEDMSLHAARYLQVSKRDFFYIAEK